MPALGGAPGSRLNVSVFAGISVSDAELVNVTAMPACTVRFGIGVSVGATFTSVTVIVNCFASFICGEPLSVTRTVMG